MLVTQSASFTCHYSINVRNPYYLAMSHCPPHFYRYNYLQSPIESCGAKRPPPPPQLSIGLWRLNARESLKALQSNAFKLSLGLGLSTKRYRINSPKKSQAMAILSFSVTLLRLVPYNRIYREYLDKLLVYF